MAVKIKDRNKETEYLRMACNLSELLINYEQADLVLRLQKRLKKLNGKFSLEDGEEIHHKWKEYWSNYYESINEEN